MNKKLYRLVFGAYIGPFLVTFFIAMFFLIMQFLWKYVDDLMGKGLDFSTLTELMFYASANLVPMALPIAILLSSIMTFGNLAETNEMTAMKSAGLSNLKIMRPLILFILFISIGSFFFANYTWPVANLKFRALISDIVQQKPTIQFREKVFYNDIDNFSIRIDKKIKDKNDAFEGVMIADHTNNPSGNPLYKKDIKAKTGNIQKTKDGQFMIVALQNGIILEELQRGMDSTDKFAHQETRFKEAKIRIDLSSLKMHRTNTDLFKDLYEMFNLKQLNHTIDSIEKTNQNIFENYAQSMRYSFLIFREPMITDQPDDTSKLNLEQVKFINNTNDFRLDGNFYNNGANSLRNFITTYEAQIAKVNGNKRMIQLMKVEWHRKLTLPFACVVLFFIGASLGTIIKKGGIGAPVVASVILFLIYYILSITGEKMAKGEVTSAFLGMWLSAIILTPLAIFLIAKSNSDSRIFDRDTYLRFFGLKKRTKKVILQPENENTSTLS